MSRRASVRRLLLAVVMAIIALFGAGRPAAANRVAAVVPGGIYAYDVPTIARVAVHGVPPVEVSQRQVIGVRQGFASPAAQAPGTSTTPTHSLNATNNVIVDTNAVYNRPGTLGALQPGETPVMTRTTVGELANNAASGRLKPPGFANELGVVDDVMDVNTRINIRGELEAIKPGQRGLFGDGSIGATAVSTGYPVITADKNFAMVLEGMGVQVRRI